MYTSPVVAGTSSRVELPLAVLSGSIAAAPSDSPVLTARVLRSAVGFSDPEKVTTHSAGCWREYLCREHRHQSQVLSWLLKGLSGLVVKALAGEAQFALCMWCGRPRPKAGN